MPGQVEESSQCPVAPWSAVLTSPWSLIPCSVPHARLSIRKAPTPAAQVFSLTTLCHCADCLSMCHGLNTSSQFPVPVLFAGSPITECCISSPNILALHSLPATHTAVALVSWWERFLRGPEHRLCKQRSHHGHPCVHLWCLPESWNEHECSEDQLRCNDECQGWLHPTAWLQVVVHQ